VFPVPYPSGLSLLFSPLLLATPTAKGFTRLATPRRIYGGVSEIWIFASFLRWVTHIFRVRVRMTSGSEFTRSLSEPPPWSYSGFDGGRTCALFFTRYRLTWRRLCTNQFVFHCPLPPALPTPWQYYCTSIAHFTTPPRPLFCMPYTIQYW